MTDAQVLRTAVEDESESMPSPPDEYDIGGLASGLRGGALFLEGVAIASALGGIVTGVILMTHHTTTDGYTTQHPYIALGCGVIAAGIIGGVFNWCIGRFLRLFAVSTAVRHGAPLRPIWKSETLGGSYDKDSGRHEDASAHAITRLFTRSVEPKPEGHD